MSENWFKDGLRFECTQCGKCCTVPQAAKEIEGLASLSFPGPALDDEKVHVLAVHLNLPEAEFRARYVTVCRQGFQSLAIVDSACVFYDRETKLCRVHEARPSHCKAFPFFHNVQAKIFWDSYQSSCEGVNREDAPLISEAEILDRLKNRKPNVYPGRVADPIDPELAIKAAAHRDQYERESGQSAMLNGVATPGYEQWAEEQMGDPRFAED